MGPLILLSFNFLYSLVSLQLESNQVARWYVSLSHMLTALICESIQVWIVCCVGRRAHLSFELEDMIIDIRSVKIHQYVLKFLNPGLRKTEII